VDKVQAVVVGAGVAGSATARALARAGRDVVLMEQFQVGHTRGSSHGRSRIFRLSYDDPAFVRMAMNALPLWRELEEEVGRQLIVNTGGIDCGTDLRPHVRALEQCGVSYELLDAAEVAERFPLLALPNGRKVLFQRDAGIALAEGAIKAFVTSAVAAGAELKEGCRVRELHVENNGVIVSSDTSTVRADVVVVTAGAWAKALLARVGINLPVTPTRETVAYFRMDEDVAFPTMVDWDEPAVYALPSPGDGVKAGEHHAGPVTDPDEVGGANDASVARLSDWVAERYPKADPEPIRAETCMYTNTSDESFILERRGPVVVGSACSGHGFKFGPLTGKRLAELATSR
jgi:monomeric sarcosine oxidase